MGNSNSASPTRDLLIELDGCGKQVPFRHMVSKGENSYWAVVRKNSAGERKNSLYGVKVAPSALQATGAKLPKKVSIIDPVTGESVSLTLKEGKTQDNRAKVSGSATVTLPGLGVERQFTASVSRTKDNQFNLKIAATNKANASGAPAVQDIDDL